jgi:EmrB/QacA subfamily drug resistance transporter
MSAEHAVGQLAGPRGVDSLQPEHARRVWILTVLCLTVFIINLDGTILNIALPRIVAGLHATSTQLQWIVDAYVIVMAGLLLIAGSMADHVGRKWVFLAGLVVFAAGSAWSALSVNPGELITARASMGVGAAMIMPTSLSILTNVYAKPVERARAIGVWSGMNGLGVAVGPVIGGWLLAHFWWGSVFLINVPIAAITCAAAYLLVPNSKNPVATRPDAVGAGLSLLGVALLLWGLIEAPVRGWTSPLILGAVALALALIVAFAWWERRSSHPLLQVSFFRSRRFSVAMVGLALTIFALSGIMFVLTQYFQFGLGYTPLQTGLRIVPIAAVLVITASTSSFVVRLIGTKLVVFAGMGSIAVGLAMLSAASIQSTYVSLLPALLLLGFGTGLSLAPCIESVMGSVPPDLAGVGSATNSTALQVGSALGVAVLGSLLNTRYLDQMTALLSRYVMPAPAKQAITGSLGGALGVAQHLGGPLGDQLASSARQAFIHGMVFSLSIGAIIAGAAAVIVAALLPARSRHRDASSSPGERPLDGARAAAARAPF